jgi:hypothetical protein
MSAPLKARRYQVAVTAWANLVGCDVFGEAVLDVVRDFRDEFAARALRRSRSDGEP